MGNERGVVASHTPQLTSLMFDVCRYCILFLSPPYHFKLMGMPTAVLLALNVVMLLPIGHGIVCVNTGK